MGNVLRGVILAWLAVGMVAGQIVLSPAPGGATTLDALTDVTITSAADGDGLRHNGTAFVNTALFTAGTSDILAARMQTNVRAAIGAGLTDGRVPYVSGGALTDSSTLAFDGTTFQVATNWYITNSQIAGAGAGVPIMDRSSTATRGYRFGQDTDTGIDWIAANNFGFYAGGALLATIGGSQTALLQDTTATTGVTSVIVKGGAGQSTNPVFTVQNNSGTANATILESGAATVASVTMAATGATFYGASANEPVSCSASIDGSIYFDTTDQKLCICANDGTDDEWLMSDDYSHLTGHCSL